MPNEPNDTPRLQLHIPTVYTGLCTVIGLAAALEIAIEKAIFIDRDQVDNESVDTRIEVLTKQLVREAKNVSIKLMRESEEVEGIATAVAIINHCVSRVRGRH